MRTANNNFCFVTLKDFQKNALHLRFNLLFIVIYSSFFRYYCGLALENSFLFIAGYQTRKIIDVVVASQWLMHDSTETSINLIF